MEEANKLRDLRTAGAYAKSQKVKVEYGRRNVTIDGFKYVPENLELLPQNLSLAAAETRSCDGGKGIAFQSKHSYLSNMYMCPFYYRGRRFNSVEQCFSYHKALESGAMNTAARVMAASCPYEQKALVYKCKPSEQWEQNQYEDLYQLQKAKFTDVKHLGDKLNATHDLVLYEATTSRSYGCGLTLRELGQINQDCPGRNECGEALSRVRADLNRIPPPCRGGRHCSTT